MFNNDGVDYITEATQLAVHAHVENGVPFHALIGTKNWEPELPQHCLENEKMLFSFVGQTLRECTIFNTLTPVLMIAMGDDVNNLTKHYYNVDMNAKIEGIYSDKEGLPHLPILVRPEYSIPEDWHPEISQDDAEHSKNVFMKNPNNAKFFA